MKKVLIYNDEGCSNTQFYMDEFGKYFNGKKIAVSFVDANSILTKNALDENVVAFVMPGGAANPYRKKLLVLGNEIISDYVKKGGAYLGICAGAYYACKDTEFEKGHKDLEIVCKYGLNLINANAKGTMAKDFNIANYTSDFSSATITKIKWQDDDEHCAYYHGGPKFDLYDEKNEVLATYADAKDTPPAIVFKKHGKGLVLLSGVHFEVNHNHLSTHVGKDNKDKERLHQLAENLSKNELARKALLNKVMQKILPGK